MYSLTLIHWGKGSAELVIDSQNAADSPIGVFDSGVGGLSVLQAISAELPNEQTIYFADTAYAPYGDRSDSEIIERSCRVTAWLVEQGCKAVVVACNTATAAAINTLRERFNIAIIGIEPGLKPAVQRSKTGRVGVLATSYTVQSDKFKHLVATVAAESQLSIQACPGLVETLEQPGEHAKQLDSLLQRYLAPMREHEVDTLVLGCTHYSFLREAIRHHLGESVTILDTPKAVAIELKRQLALRSILSQAGETFSSQRYLTTGMDVSAIQTVMQSLTHENITLEQFRE